MFHIHTYPNGLQVIISPQRATEAVTVLVMVRVGSRNESAAVNGVAHFTEHMMFKGTTRRPNTLAISQELDAVGADYNAFTSKEYTGYYIKVAAEHLPLALDMLADMLQHSKFEAKDIAKEKGVIVEEINMYEDSPMLMLEDVFDMAAYPRTVLARDVAGTKQTVGNLRRADFIRFVSRNYYPGNMLVSVAGNVDSDKVVKAVGKYFARQKFAGHGQSSRKKISLSQRSPRVYIKHKATEQIHLALGYAAKITPRSSRIVPLKLAQVLFGGNMSSRLFIRIREREGLCYYIRSRVNTFQDVGNFTVYAGLDKERIDRAVTLILRQWRELRLRGATAKELKMAQEYVRGKMVLGHEDSANIAQWYAEQWLFAKKIETPEKFLQKIDSVTTRQVQQALNSTLDARRLNLAVIGKFDDAQHFTTLLRHH